jgi:tetratricopeptide (TPR) repeat protein
MLRRIAFVSIRTTFQTRLLTALECIELNKKAAEKFTNGEFVEAAKSWEEVVKFELADRKPDSQPNPNLVHSLHNLACAYGELGSFEKKKAHLEQALQMIDELYGDRHPQYAMALFNLASVYGELGDSKKMKEAVTRSLVIHEEKFGPNHPKVGRVLSLLATAHEKLEEYKEQVEVSQRALQIIQKHCGAEHTQTTIAMTNLGRAYGNVDDTGRMIQLIQSAFAIQERKLGPQNPQIAPTLLELALAHGRIGEHLVKKTLLEKAVDIQKRAFGGMHVFLVESYMHLGDACSETKEFDLAQEYYMASLSVAESKHGESHPVVAAAKSNLAVFFQRVGNKKAALSFARSAIDIYGKMEIPSKGYLNALSIVESNSSDSK